METKERKIRLKEGVMKAAEGTYTKVKAITREEAIALAPRIFETGRAIKKLREEAKKLEARASRLLETKEEFSNEFMRLRDRLKILTAQEDYAWVQERKCEAEAKILNCEVFKLRVEEDLLWVTLALKHRGYIPDWQSMNFIAADLEDKVYSFVRTYEEIWIYSGVRCPGRSLVDKVEWKEDDTLANMNSKT